MIHINASNGKKIYFASDQHLGAPTLEASLPREKKFVAWLDSIEKNAEALFLLGDLFDFWFEYKTVVPKGFVRVLGKLAEIKDISKELSLDALQAVEDFFNGKQFNGTSTGEGFKSYLLYLERDDIYISIRDQFNLARLEINNLTNNLSEQVTIDNSKMTRAYDELQKAVVLLKVDMLQAFSINIDYVDADGD